MRIGRNKLKMSSGEVRTFRSEGARDRFERFAQAYKRGWRPSHLRAKIAIRRRRKQNG